MAWIVVAITTLIVALFVVELQIAAPPYMEETSNHFDGKKFVNPNDGDTHHYWEVLKWWLSGYDRGEWYQLNEEDLTQHPLPPSKVSTGNFKATFVNHATYLLQVDDLNILTDPVWSFRASPYQWIGPKRMRPPGIAFEDLPDIDVVLLTHNHYDHLDLSTVKKLQKRYKPKFIVPLGVEKLLHDHGIINTSHLDWWDHHPISNSLSLTAVPAQHFSGRGLFDRNKTLWCGYVLHASIGNIYFAGDTGYGDFIRAIGNKFGPIHTSFLPIGAYKPRWFMQKIHMSPREAVKAHKYIQSQQSFAMHFGTFPMADDGMYEPIEELKHALEEFQINKQQFRVLNEGESEFLTPIDSANVA
ncbi:MBL fold metallo-hydrolase [Fodinibius saliphilus]|uniref:MBL fold metallo-hydrolase n=1 Tax=Fodinibius saliphilus TaxID=1920650 RepID=UPI001109CB99|nr:MBL fold metallo-hydrolase [Fodinibius saliphilus]